MAKLIIITALFSLVFINSYKPFNSEQWVEGNSQTYYFILSFLLVLIGILVLAVSRYLMYRIVRKHSMYYAEYALWVFLEIVVLAGFYTLFALILDDDLLFWDWKSIITVFRDANINTFLIVFIPYAFSWMYFSYSDKRDRLKELENGIMFRKRSAVFQFKDEKGEMRFSVPMEHIVYLEAADNYVEINYLNQGKISQELLRNSLKRVAQDLVQTPVQRCHRSYMVNFDHVVALRKNGDEIDIELDVPNIKKIPVSKSYSDDAIMAFLQYSQEAGGNKVE
ncbi:MAG: LytTR family transcriptional regulator [Paludibacteraceae bacterium]|nr:LytTR family transcriptional regulator [Paludibacteraceae bacterium]